jgi:hypothetical protein
MERTKEENNKRGTVVLDDARFPLVIIGAGPHALSLITKLIEPSLDPLEENPNNKTLFKISSNKKRVGAKYKLLPDHIFTQKDGTIRSKWSKSSRERKTHESFLNNVCIIDRNKTFLEQWKHQFEMLEIPNLRSALGAHCDPIDPQCMRIFIEGNGDRDSSVVNLKLDRSMAYHGPYEVPITHIYNKFSDAIVERYHLENSITQGTVDDVELVYCNDNDGNSDNKQKSLNHYFNVLFKDSNGIKKKITAENVVFATGKIDIDMSDTYKHHVSNIQYFLFVYLRRTIK